MRYYATLFLLLTTGCTSMMSSRTYLSEMEYDDSSYFSPGEDFPVMAGDNGEYYRSSSDLRKRTPITEEERNERLASSSLKRELRSLESSQTEKSFEHYSKYRDRLKTVSEKIYFLKLSPSEKQDYLYSKGFLEEERISAVGARMPASTQNSLAMGMTKDQILMTYGKPGRVEVAGNPSFENERWMYVHKGTAKWIYFESGKVGGWE